MEKLPEEKITLLISSQQDPAGSRIHKEIHRLLEENPGLGDHLEHLMVPERLIYLDGPSLPTYADQILFLSRHSSKQPRPVMTVHVTGNFGTADFGGEDKTLTPAATPLMYALIRELALHAPEGYEVMYEATHHGPTNVPLPSCFVEIGSSEQEWNDPKGTAAVARAVLGALKRDTKDIIPLVGFGGTHYTQRQTEIALTTRGGFGHVMPTRDICHLSCDLFHQMILLSKATALYIDGKSVSNQDERLILDFAREVDIQTIGQGELQRIGSMPFPDYLSVRDLARSQIPGCSIIVNALNEAPIPVIIRVPEELLDEVIRISNEEFITALDTIPVVRLTGKGRSCHAQFITNADKSASLTEELIHLCVKLLQSRDECSFDGEILVIRKKRFDPGKAKDLGVPAGPLFGELMAGKTVTIKGTEISADMVTTNTEKRIFIPVRQGR